MKSSDRKNILSQLQQLRITLGSFRTSKLKIATFYNEQFLDLTESWADKEIMWIPLERFETRFYDLKQLLRLQLVSSIAISIERLKRFVPRNCINV